MIIAPPLICNRREIDNLVSMLARALDETARALRRPLRMPRAPPPLV